MIHNLLRTAQLIASSMDSEEFNDINDTVESRQIVDIIEQVYNDICSQIEFPDHWDLFQLDPSNDPTRPTLMYLPENVAKVEWIQYDHADIGSPERLLRPVLSMPRVQFFNRMNMYSTDKAEVYQYDYMVGQERFDIRGVNDKHPSYYTTVDNRTLIFDSYDASQGSFLIADRLVCYGMKIPVFVRDNEFVPQFEPRQFTLFFNEAKAQCFLELKQIENARAERTARRGWVNSQRKKMNTEASAIKPWLPNYGRKGR